MATRPALAMAGRPLDAGRRIRAIAFDGFTVFDPRAVTAAVVAMVPERGMALASAWTNKLFALSWLETSAGRYSGFEALAGAALDHSASTLGIDLKAAQKADLVRAYRRLPVWPDAAAGLARLRETDVRLAFLSNLSADLLLANTRRNGLEHLFERPMSTDQVRAFKPSAKAYAMAMEGFGLGKREIGFAAFGGWDALGASWFGYRTAWTNRLAAPAETLEPAPAVVAPDFAGVLELAGLLPR